MKMTKVSTIFKIATLLSAIIGLLLTSNCSSRNNSNNDSSDSTSELATIKFEGLKDISALGNGHLYYQVVKKGLSEAEEKNFEDSEFDNYITKLTTKDFYEDDTEAREKGIVKKELAEEIVIQFPEGHRIIFALVSNQVSTQNCDKSDFKDDKIKDNGGRLNIVLRTRSGENPAHIVYCDKNGEVGTISATKDVADIKINAVSKKSAIKYEISDIQKVKNEDGNPKFGNVSKFIFAIVHHSINSGREHPMNYKEALDHCQNGLSGGYDLPTLEELSYLEDEFVVNNSAGNILLKTTDSSKDPIQLRTGQRYWTRTEIEPDSPMVYTVQMDGKEFDTQSSKSDSIDDDSIEQPVICVKTEPLSL